MACQKGDEKLVQNLIDIALRTLIKRERVKEWINARTADHQFTAIHFASFKGNIELIETLLSNGADMHARNKFGINVLHVAAQGDCPISLYYFMNKNMDISSKDDRGSTPLHWACYSKSEIALCYLLAWVKNLEEKDVDGYTPLHLAVKSTEQLKNTRPVKSLLLRGA